MITMQTMKRLLAFALALTMVFALAACGGKSGTTQSTAAAPGGRRDRERGLQNAVRL